MTNLDASAPRTHNLAYPKTLEALKSATNRERAVGEALFEECGGRSGAGQKDGSRAGVEAARAEFIEVHGEHDLPSVEVLCRWKNVAQSFRGCWDSHNVSWGAREVAGTPNQLTEIVHRLNNPAPSRDDIRAAKKTILAETREAKRLTDLAAAEKKRTDSQRLMDEDKPNYQKHLDAFKAAGDSITELSKKPVVQVGAPMIKASKNLVEKFWGFVQKIDEQKETFVDDDREQLIRDLTRIRNEATAGLKALGYEIQ